MAPGGRPGEAGPPPPPPPPPPRPPPPGEGGPRAARGEAVSRGELSFARRKAVVARLRAKLEGMCEKPGQRRMLLSGLDRIEDAQLRDRFFQTGARAGPRPDLTVLLADVFAWEAQLLPLNLRPELAEAEAEKWREVRALCRAACLLLGLPPVLFQTAAAFLWRAQRQPPEAGHFARRKYPTVYGGTAAPEGKAAGLLDGVRLDWNRLCPVDEPGFREAAGQEFGEWLPYLDRNSLLAAATLLLAAKVEEIAFQLGRAVQALRALNHVRELADSGALGPPLYPPGLPERKRRQLDSVLADLLPTRWLSDLGAYGGPQPADAQRRPRVEHPITEQEGADARAAPVDAFLGFWSKPATGPEKARKLERELRELFAGKFKTPFGRLDFSAAEWEEWGDEWEEPSLLPSLCEPLLGKHLPTRLDAKRGPRQFPGAEELPGPIQALVLMVERDLLSAISVTVHWDNPQPHLKSLCAACGCDGDDPGLRDTAFGLLNDCILYTPLCLEHPPARMACAALHVADLFRRASGSTARLEEGWIQTVGGETREAVEAVGHALLDMLEAEEAERQRLAG